MPWEYLPSLMMMKKKNKIFHAFLYLVTRYKNFFDQKELQTKMSSLLNVSNGSSKLKEKNNGISIIAKNNEEEEHPYISIC